MTPGDCVRSRPSQLPHRLHDVGGEVGHLCLSTGYAGLADAQLLHLSHPFLKFLGRAGQRGFLNHLFGDQWGVFRLERGAVVRVEVQ